MLIVALVIVEYEDKEGRKFRRGLPQGAPRSQAAIGVPLGPPSLQDLGLPKEIEVALHNQLYARAIFTEADARSHLQDIHSALVSALRCDVNRILAVYHGQGAQNGKAKLAEGEPVTRLPH